MLLNICQTCNITTFFKLLLSGRSGLACANCNGKVEELWSLGDLPPSDTFCPSKQEALDCYTERLAVGICHRCGLIQNVKIVDEQVRYTDTDYSYNSANSTVAVKHWTEYAEFITEIAPKKDNLKILEIGSNDGFCANAVKSLNPSAIVVGLDASGTQVESARSAYPECHFDQCVFGRENDKYEPKYFDIVFANNVVNHSNQLSNFLTRIRELLTDNGVFVFEVPSMDVAFLSGKWDQIYHEHVSYFTINSINHILCMNGFQVLDMKIVDFHGGSLRVVCCKGDPEIRLKFDYNLFHYRNNVFKLRSIADTQKGIIRKIIQKVPDGVNFYLFGAPAKGVTLINYCELSSVDVQGCLEGSQSKIGKYIPKAGIPILDENEVVSGSVVFNLIWNLPHLFDSFCRKHNLIVVNYENYSDFT